MAGVGRGAVRHTRAAGLPAGAVARSWLRPWGGHLCYGCRLFLVCLDVNRARGVDPMTLTVDALISLPVVAQCPQPRTTLGPGTRG